MFTTSAATQPDDASGSDAASADIAGFEDRPVGTRSANRAAKRAATGVRAKPMARGGRSGGRKRNSNTGIIVLAIGAVVIGAAVLLFGNPFGNGTTGPSPAGSPVAYGDGTCPTSEPAPLPAGQIRSVTVTTPMGAMIINVEADLSPIAAGNFVALVQCHFYDGSVFHRTASQDGTATGTPFVIQGGAAKPGTAQIPYTITDEPVTAQYKRGTVAMARSSDPNSQTSQFFIVLDDGAGSILSATNTYAIFGEVVSGMAVADAIYKASNGVELPTNPIPMTSVTVSAAPLATASAAPAATPPSSIAPTGAAPAASN
ncbi:MAG TPA: peptidylprolyl isomerase [Candidatus Limnocylindrales bacterium]|jgi:cyclophilin family peptidyl-prolyl cis-trans isomerase